jgi:hypothetical protein
MRDDDNSNNNNNKVKKPHYNANSNKYDKKCDGKFILSLKHSTLILLETKTEMCFI